MTMKNNYELQKALFIVYPCTDLHYFSPLPQVAVILRIAQGKESPLNGVAEMAYDQNRNL